MSVEKDYSGSYGDDDCLIVIIENLLIQWDWQIQKTKADYRLRFTNLGTDIEYVDLFIDEVNKDINKNLARRIASLRKLSEEKLRDYRNRKE